MYAPRGPRPGKFKGASLWGDFSKLTTSCDSSNTAAVKWLGFGFNTSHSEEERSSSIQIFPGTLAPSLHCCRPFTDAQRNRSMVCFLVESSTVGF